MFIKNGCRFICKRTVHINFEIIVSVNASFFFDLTDEIKHLLRTSYRKGWNHNTSPAIKGSLDHLTQKSYIIRTVTMASVTVGRLHHDIIRIVKVYRIFDQRLIEISDITGKNNLFLFAVFVDDHFNACRSKQVSGIDKTYTDTFRRCDRLFIWTRNKILQDTHCIFHRICRYKLRLALTTSLTVTPFCLEHLDMGAVSKHNVTEMAGRLCRINRSLKTFCIDCRQISGMIHMCVGQKHKIKVTSLNRYFLIFIIIGSLFHTTVYKKLLTGSFQIITASGYFMCRPNKGYLHVRAPFV